MRVPAGTKGEPFYRVQDDDCWQTEKEVCRTCFVATPDGVDQCELCVEFELENPPEKEWRALDDAQRVADIRETLRLVR